MPQMAKDKDDKVPDASFEVDTSEWTLEDWLRGPFSFVAARSAVHVVGDVHGCQEGLAEARGMIRVKEEARLPAEYLRDDPRTARPHARRRAVS